MASDASGASQDLRFGITDYVVFVIMLGASAGIGVYFGFFSKTKNTTEEYLRGGKKIGEGAEGRMSRWTSTIATTEVGVVAQSYK